MKMQNIAKSAGKMLGKTTWKLKKGAPTIMVLAGVAGVIGGVVMACKATPKVTPIMEEHNDKMEELETRLVAAEGDPEPSAEEIKEVKQDKIVLKVQTGVKLAKVYAPAACVIGVSLVSILTSHKIMRSRNASLAAACAAFSRDFTDYRKGVIERFGKQVDYEIRNHVKPTEIEEEEANKETGEVKTAKKTVDVVDESHTGYSPYARFFDETSDAWVKNAESNLTFLLQKQAEMNVILQHRAAKSPSGRGIVWLNEVYKELGLEPTKAGQVVGWIYDKYNPIENHLGDNYIDFGIHDVRKTAARRFVNGYERSILLDFNVDGEIWSMLGEE